MTDVEQIQWEEARSAVYGFFSQAFIRGPSQQFLEALISDEGTANLREIFPDAAYRQELAQVRLDAREGRLTLEEAVLDFEALFRVPGSRYLSPYESVYRSQGAGGRGGLCGPETAAVERLYLKEGLGPNAEFTELPDHVGVELEFMAFLCRKAVEAMQAGDAATAAGISSPTILLFHGTSGAVGRTSGRAPGLPGPNQSLPVPGQFLEPLSGPWKVISISGSEDDLSGRQGCRRLPGPRSGTVNPRPDPI